MLDGIQKWLKRLKNSNKICFRHKIPRFLHREMLHDVQAGRLHVAWLTPVHDDAFVSARSSTKTTVVFFS